MLRTRMHPLGEFISKQIEKYQISDAAFARKIGVDPSTVSLWMSDDPPKEPSYKLLRGLALATSTDICALVALVDPELTRTNAQVQIAAGLIADLAPDEFDALDTYLLALSFKGRDKPK